MTDADKAAGYRAAVAADAEPRYTLAEARGLVVGEMCAARGHDLTSAFLRDPDGDVIWERYWCSRCEHEFTLAPVPPA